MIHGVMVVVVEDDLIGRENPTTYGVIVPH
jgi:hypothetical protein